LLEALGSPLTTHRSRLDRHIVTARKSSLSWFLAYSLKLIAQILEMAQRHTGTEAVRENRDSGGVEEPLVLAVMDLDVR
jgi:hypothetical protein